MQMIENTMKLVFLFCRSPLHTFDAVTYFLSLFKTYTLGRQCVFPFGYQGKTYNGCTIADAPDNKKWCSVQVDSDGNHIGGRGLWGHCGGDCPTDLDGSNSGSSPPACTPVDCQWAGWRNWGTCSKTCCETGRTSNSQSRRTTNSNCGTRKRVRGIRQQAQCGGKECSPLDEEEIEQCNTTPCPSAAPIDCQWDTWSSWSPCSGCDNGSRSRRRRIKVAAQNGGRPCNSKDVETESCSSPNCPIKDDDSKPKRKFSFILYLHLSWIMHPTTLLGSLSQRES